MTEKTITNADVSIFSCNKKWEELIEDKNFVTVFLSDILEEYIQKQRWFGGKSSKLKYIELSEYFRIQQNLLFLVKLSFLFHNS